MEKGYRLDFTLDVIMGLIFRDVPAGQQVSSVQKAVVLSSKSIKFLRSLGFKVFENGNAGYR